jgi:hypothetical protein
MLVLVFLIGALLGTLVGGAICVRYLRQEVAASIGPTLRSTQVQLNNLESVLNLAIATQQAEISRYGERRLARGPKQIGCYLYLQELAHDGRLGHPRYPASS